MQICTAISAISLDLEYLEKYLFQQKVFGKGTFLITKQVIFNQRTDETKRLQIEIAKTESKIQKTTLHRKLQNQLKQHKPVETQRSSCPEPLIVQIQLQISSTDQDPPEREKTPISCKKLIKFES